MLLRSLILSVVLITVTATYMFPQSKTDSLESLLLKQKEDTVKVRLLNTLGWLYLNSDLAKTTSYENQALILSKKLNFKSGEAIAITHLGYVEILSGNFQNALSDFNKSLEIFRLTGDKAHIATTYTNIANAYYYLAEYSKNIEYNNLSLKISIEMKDSSGIANTYTSLGNAYLKLGDYPESLDYFMNSLKIYEKRNDSLLMPACYNNIAIVYKRQADTENAMKYYQKALDLSLKFNNTRAAGESYNNIGVLYMEDSKNKEAEEFFKKAISFFQTIDYQVGISTVTGNIGQIYMNTGDYDKALDYFYESAGIEQRTGDMEGYATTLNNIATTYYEQTYYEPALINALKCLDISRQINSLVQLNRVYKLLADIYKAEKNFPKAYEYLDLFVSSSDSLFNIEKAREIENVKTLYEVEKKEAEIESLHQKTEILEKENKIQELRLGRNRLVGIFAAGILIMVIISSVLFINRQRIKIKKDKQIHDTKKSLMDLEIKNVILEKNKLNSELEFRKKELTAMASQIIEKNNLIEEIEGHVKAIRENKDMNYLDSLSKINLELNLNKNREDFNSQVEELHKDFFFNLSEKFPDLTRNEKKLAALLRMELSSKEISGILNISSKSVDMNRYRLRKKLDLDNEINISEFLKTV